MSSTLIRIVVAVGLFATLAINIVAPRIGVEHAPPSVVPTSPPPAGPRLIPVPPNMR